MTKYLLSPVPIRHTDNNSDPVPFARLHTYSAGTTTPLATYTDATGTTPLANPIIADAEGYFPQIWVGSAAYDLQCREADDLTVVWSSSSVTSPGGTTDVYAATVAASTGANLVGYGSSTVGAKLDLFKAVSDSASLQAAVSAAYSAGAVLYSSGSVAAPGNITNLHDVYKFGSWAITRSGNTWYTQPTNSQTNTIFVATSGSDTNDGITAALPVATLARALAILASYGPALSQGTWVVSVAAGTYSQGLIDFPVCLSNRNRIQITGPTVAHPSIPTAIFDGGGTQAYGLNFNSRALVSVACIKFQNYTTYGVVGQDLGDVLTSNVHVSGVPGGPGIKVQQGRLRVQGGIISACQTGINCIGGSTFTIGDPAGASLVGGTQILNCTQQGILAQEQSSGHADYCTVTNCAVGLDATVHSRFHAVGCAITANATAGVRCTDSSSWLDNGTSSLFATNGVNELIYNAEGEIGRDGARTVEQRQAVDITFVTQTGTTSATTVKTYASAIAAVNFNSSVKSWRMEVSGELSGTAGTKNIVVNLAGSPAFGFTIPAAATGSYRIIGTVRAQSASAQSYSAVCDVTGQTTQVATGSRSIAMMGGSAIAATIVVTMGNAADSLTVRCVEQFNAGGC